MKKLYWTAQGQVLCEQHIPLKGSDTWVNEGWREVPAEALPHLAKLPGGHHCERCAGW